MPNKTNYSKQTTKSNKRKSTTTSANRNRGVVVSRSSGPRFFSFSPKMTIAAFAVVFGIIGISTLLLTRAATPGSTWEDAGAHLPISYNIASLTGTVRYVAPGGNDTSGTGSASAPYATLAKAYSVAGSGDNIVVRGGTYRQGNVTITSAKPVKIIAYPGETPVFDGAAAVPATTGWVTEGSLKYRAYTPMPVTDGSGISFTTGQNLAGDGVGKYPDQAWVGTTQLRQVSAKGSVVAGKFYVDRTNNRIYLLATDVSKGSIEVANLRNFITVQAPGTTLEGLKITRYSNTASDYGVVKVTETADNFTARNVDISDTAFIAMLITGGSRVNKGATLKNVSVSTSNWMGVSASYTDNLTFDQVYLKGMNQWSEFTYSPQSGAIKTSRTRYTKVLNSQIRNNVSHGMWFDQSNYDVQVAGNVIADNSGTAVFFEISDKLTLANNYIRTKVAGARAVKLAGSSGLRLINNTIFGGVDPVGIYVDSRSIAGCANPAHAVCAGSYSSDRDTLRPYLPTITWIPRLDMMVNNVISYPTAAGYCTTTTDVCITQTNGSANVPLNTIIHKADSVSPQTIINGNVYANGTGNIINTAVGKFTTTSAFSAAMAKAPVSISGFEAAGLYGNTYVSTADGNPTSALAALHSSAAVVPTDAIVNQYVPAGTKHYGVTFR